MVHSGKTLFEIPLHGCLLCMCMSKRATVRHGPLHYKKRCAICWQHNWKPLIVSCHFFGFVLDLVCFSASEICTNGALNAILKVSLICFCLTSFSKSFSLHLGGVMSRYVGYVVGRSFEKLNYVCSIVEDLFACELVAGPCHLWLLPVIRSWLVGVLSASWVGVWWFGFSQISMAFNILYFMTEIHVTNPKWVCLRKDGSCYWIMMCWFIEKSLGHFLLADQFKNWAWLRVSGYTAISFTWFKNGWVIFKHFSELLIIQILQIRSSESHVCIYILYIVTSSYASPVQK